MTIIRLPKNIEDIQEPEVLPEDYYKLRLIEEPEVAPNKKKQEGGETAPGAGNNLIMSMRVVSDNPEQNGRPFKKWIGLPTTADKTDVMKSGMTREDSKLKMLGRIQAGFTGVAPEGDEINLQAGMEAWCYITQGLNQAGTGFENDLDFMQDIKPV